MDSNDTVMATADMDRGGYRSAWSQHEAWYQRRSCWDGVVLRQVKTLDISLIWTKRRKAEEQWQASSEQWLDFVWDTFRNWAQGFFFRCGTPQTLKMPTRLTDCLMEPENLAKLLAKTGLLSATLNQDGFFSSFHYHSCIHWIWMNLNLFNKF